MRFEGPDGPAAFWENRWFLTGEEFQQGIAGAVNYFLPFSKLEKATLTMREIIDRHQIAHYAQQMFPEPTGAEHVSLLFHHPGDAAEYEKIQGAVAEMMDTALSLGGAPLLEGPAMGALSGETPGPDGLLGHVESHQEGAGPESYHEPRVCGTVGAHKVSDTPEKNVHRWERWRYLDAEEI